MTSSYAEPAYVPAHVATRRAEARGGRGAFDRRPARLSCQPHAPPRTSIDVRILAPGPRALPLERRRAAVRPTCVETLAARCSCPFTHDSCLIEPLTCCYELRASERNVMPPDISVGLERSNLAARQPSRNVLHRMTMRAAQICRSGVAPTLTTMPPSWTARSACRWRPRSRRRRESTAGRRHRI